MKRASILKQLLYSAGGSGFGLPAPQNDGCPSFTADARASFAQPRLSRKRRQIVALTPPAAESMLRSELGLWSVRQEHRSHAEPKDLRFDSGFRKSGPPSPEQ